jgi:hypothetical protein
MNGTSLMLKNLFKGDGMSIANAKKFLAYLEKHPKVVEEMKGFSLEELKKAVKAVEKEKGKPGPLGGVVKAILWE